MFIQFTVKNFRSFREQTVLSLAANTKNDISHNVAEVGNKRLLKHAIIFGPNAAGKSNLFKAMVAGLMAVRRSNSRQVNETDQLMVPFLFNDDSKNKPCHFEFQFIASDNLKYTYGFSATKKLVFDEYLYVNKSKKTSKIFARIQDAYSFTSVYKSELQPLTEKNTSNKLFISTATAWNSKSTKKAFEWLTNSIDVHSSDIEYLSTISLGYYGSKEVNRYSDFATSLLKSADINVEKLSIEHEDVIVSNRGSSVEFENDDNNVAKKRVKVNLDHQAYNASTESSKSFSLSIFEESRGTQEIFFLSPLIQKALDNGECLCMDEFDSSLHPALCRHIIKLFSNPDINKNNAQLIVSTHTMDLLDLDVLRRDQFYFVDKDAETLGSEIFSLDEFSPRKDENIRKNYLIGRYGASPDIVEGVLL